MQTLRVLLFIFYFEQKIAKATNNKVSFGSNNRLLLCGIKPPGRPQAAQRHILYPRSAILWIGQMEFADSDE